MKLEVCDACLRMSGNGRRNVIRVTVDCRIETMSVRQQVVERHRGEDRLLGTLSGCTPAMAASNSSICGAASSGVAQYEITALLAIGFHP